MARSEEESSDGPRLHCYDRISSIGHGSYGSVHLYHVKDEHEQRSELPHKMAVKMILTKGETNMRETELCRRIKHKNIIGCYGVEGDQCAIYIKMEFAKSNLKSFQDEIIAGAIGDGNFLHFALQLAEGLSFLHEQGIVHRDIKPQNILVLWPDDVHDVKDDLSSVTLKLCDFGCSRDDQLGTMTMTIMGTQAYMAPEIAEALTRQPLVPFVRVNYEKADIYSLGLVFHQLLFNRLPVVPNGSECSTLFASHADVSIREEFSALLRLMLSLESRARITATCAIEMMRPWHYEEMFELKMSQLADGLPRIKEEITQSQIRLDELCQILKNPPHANCKIKRQKWLHLKPKATIAYMEEACGDNAMRPLHEAAADGDLAQIGWLLDSGDDVNRADGTGWTPLAKACYGCHLPAAQLLIQRGADIHRSNKYGSPPLQWACEKGHLPIVKLLLERGADVNKAESSGWMPLHYACFHGHLRVAELLIKSRADKTARNVDGKTPLDIAESEMKEQFVDLFSRV